MAREPHPRPLAAYDEAVEVVGDARVILPGEATHGTREFYRARFEITKLLIEEHGFAAVAVEADWPDAYRVNCFVRGVGDDGSAEEALRGFTRFPTWMWLLDLREVESDVRLQLRRLQRARGDVSLRLHPDRVDARVGSATAGQLADARRDVALAEVDRLDAVPPRHLEPRRYDVDADDPLRAAVARDSRAHLADRAEAEDRDRSAELRRTGAGPTRRWPST